MGADDLKNRINIFQSVNNFCKEDYDNLDECGPLLIPHIEEITDEFYENLKSSPETAKYIEGRVEQLKRMHVKWLEDVFKVGMNEVFVENQLRIGRAHVEAKVPPLFVAASLSHMRSVFPRIIEREASGREESVASLVGTCLKMLDLCQYLIDYSYEQDRFKRITCATGLSLPLLENLISLKPRS